MVSQLAEKQKPDVREEPLLAAAAEEEQEETGLEGIPQGVLDAVGQYDRDHAGGCG